MKEAQTYIKNYKDNKFLPSVNFEGDLLVSEEELAEMLQEYADKQLLLYGVSKLRGHLFAFEKWQQTQFALPDEPLKVVDMYLNSK